jgi:hypothetical protein
MLLEFAGRHSLLNTARVFLYHVAAERKRALTARLSGRQQLVLHQLSLNLRNIVLLGQLASALAAAFTDTTVKLSDVGDFNEFDGRAFHHNGTVFYHITVKDKHDVVVDNFDCLEFCTLAQLGESNKEKFSSFKAHTRLLGAARGFSCQQNSGLAGPVHAR